MEDVLLRPSSLEATGLTYDGTVAFLDGYVARSEHIVVRRRVRPSIQDPNDEIFVECFVNGLAFWIVSFNRRDYLSSDPRRASLGESPVSVILPGEALESLPWRPSATTPFAFPRL